jgi:hypothetical protein
MSWNEEDLTWDEYIYDEQIQDHTKFVAEL